MDRRILPALKELPVPYGKPNLLVLWGDDIGIGNLSCDTDGLMGYRTPNIDRIADEGVRFTDCYGEQSCTAGRAAFIIGRNPDRTGRTRMARTLVEFPPRRESAGFTVGAMLEKLKVGLPSS